MKSSTIRGVVRWKEANEPGNHLYQEDLNERESKQQQAFSCYPHRDVYGLRGVVGMPSKYGANSEGEGMGSQEEEMTGSVDGVTYGSDGIAIDYADGTSEYREERWMARNPYRNESGQDGVSKFAKAGKSECRNGGD